MRIEEQLQRLEMRQEAMIAAIHGLADVIEINRDMIAELMKWLQEPPSSELPDLLQALIKRTSDMQDQVKAHGDLVVKLGRRFDDLPAAVARAMHTGEVA